MGELPVTTKRKKDKPQDSAGSAEFSGRYCSSVPTAALLQTTTYSCPNCDLVFDSKIGLGVHRHFKHQVITNEEIDLTRTKKRWPKEELALLAKTEAMLSRKNIRYMNMELCKYHPERTLEGIKGQRRLDEYKNLVSDYMRMHVSSEASALGNARSALGPLTLPDITTGLAASSTRGSVEHPPPVPATEVSAPCTKGSVDETEVNPPSVHHASGVVKSSLTIGSAVCPPREDHHISERTTCCPSPTGRITRSKTRLANASILPSTTSTVPVREQRSRNYRQRETKDPDVPLGQGYDPMENESRHMSILSNTSDISDIITSSFRLSSSQDNELEGAMSVSVAECNTVREAIPNGPSPQEALQALQSDEPLNRLYGEAQLDRLVNDALIGRDTSARQNEYLCRYMGLSSSTQPRNIIETIHRPIRAPSKRQKRITEYAKVQSLYKKNRKKCARYILDGEKDNIKCSLEELVAFWKPIFSADSTPVPLTLRKNDVCGGVWAGITIGDVESALPDRTSAPGPDGLTAISMRKIPPRILAKLFNLLLLSKKLPEVLHLNKTIFIPKAGSDGNDPKDLRPITMPSLLVRSFHKILAVRLGTAMKLNTRQKAFRPVDGCFENTFILQKVVSEAWSRKKELHLATLDLTKAFDSVSHFAIFAAADRQGMPREFLSYIRNIYVNSVTTIYHKGGKSEPICMSRGVKQGDPLSPLLFNAVMDEALDSLDCNIGFRIGGNNLNSMGFADDMNLLASTKNGLQHVITQFDRVLSPKGLLINTEKSHTLSLIPSGRDSKVKVVTDGEPFTVQNKPIRRIGIGSPWKYLGIVFSAIGQNHKDLSTELSRGLELLRRATIKPQQRLFILKKYLLPRYNHTLVLGKARISSLNQLDILLRIAVRAWLRLPHDTPKAYFHTAVKGGGLGIQSFRWGIARQRYSRLLKLQKSTDPIIANIVKGQEFQRELHNSLGMCMDGLKSHVTKDDSAKVWETQLYESVDGRGLKESSRVPAAHYWVGDGNLLLSGHEYIEMLKLRINALPTRARTSRGRQSETCCRAGCVIGTNKAKETLPHILQCCDRTYGLRIKRHDAISNMIGDRLGKRGWSVLKEPHFKTTEGLRKPDLVITKDKVTWVIDTQIVLDSVPLKRKHQEKVAYYKQNESLNSLIKEKTEVEGDILFTSATINWRGNLEASCARDLLALGLSKNDFKYMSIRVLQGGLQMWRFFNRVTGVCRPDERTGVG